MLKIKEIRVHEPEIIRVSGWEQYGWLRHGFSTRTGGVSKVYSQDQHTGELNLGWTNEDDPGNVAENRRCFARTVISARWNPRT